MPQDAVMFFSSKKQTNNKKQTYDHTRVKTQKYKVAYSSLDYHERTIILLQ